jgi:acetyltransferase-like isoleucine patch superfamily enzyme
MSLCIGNWVMIGNQVSIADNEPLELDEIVNNFPPFNRGLLCKGGITIEDNVLVEDGVRILTGVSIGRNAIIRAGAVVRDSVPANSIVGGNPAVVLNYINSSTH